MFVPEPPVLVGFRLINDGHVAVFLKLLEMDANQTPQLLFGGCRLAYRIPKPLENLAGLVLVELNQDVVLVLEIEVDGPVCHPSLFSDLRNRRLKKPLFGKYGNGRIQDTLVFVHIFLFGADGEPPGNGSL